MRGKLMFLGGVAVGFVLGARAGRERYDQLVGNARKLWDHPTVQEAAGVVQAQANRIYHEGKDVVSDKLSHTRLGERLGNGGAPAEQTGQARPGRKTSQSRKATAGSEDERDPLAGTGKRPPGSTF